MTFALAFSIFPFSSRTSHFLQTNIDNGDIKLACTNVWDIVYEKHGSDKRHQEA